MLCLPVEVWSNWRDFEFSITYILLYVYVYFYIIYPSVKLNVIVIIKNNYPYFCLILSFLQYIENLESLKQLQVLNLSGNCIEKIERLEKLTQLQELNLSFNNIRKVEGIENLVGLQVINLTGNQIEHIPSWLGKRLKSLRVFKIAKNNLVSVSIKLYFV